MEVALRPRWRLRAAAGLVLVFGVPACAGCVGDYGRGRVTVVNECDVPIMVAVVEGDTLGDETFGKLLVGDYDPVGSLSERGSFLVVVRDSIGVEHPMHVPFGPGNSEPRFVIAGPDCPA